MHYRIKKIAIFIIVLVISHSALSQSQHLLSSSGNSNLFPGLRIDWSIGETVVGNEIFENTFIIAQGFHQNLITFIPEETNKKYFLKIYPNPAQSYLYVKRPAFLDGVNYKLYDFTGKLIEQKRMVGNPGKLNINDLSTGLYIIYFWSLDNKLIGYKKFIKN